MLNVLTHLVCNLQHAQTGPLSGVDRYREVSAAIHKGVVIGGSAGVDRIL